MIIIKDNIVKNTANVVGSYKALLYFTGGATNIENTQLYLENNICPPLDRSTYSLVNSRIDYVTYETAVFTNVLLIPQMTSSITEVALVDHIHDDRYLTETEITTNYRTSTAQDLIDGTFITTT